MKNLSHNNIERILILKWSALGDLIISTAIFEDVHRAFPDAAIDLQTSRAYQKLFIEDPRFDKVLSVDLKGEDCGAAGMWRLLNRVRTESYDLIIDLQANDRSRLFLSLFRFMNCGRIPIIGLHGHFPYHLAPGKDAPQGFIRQQLALKAAGIESNSNRPRLYVPQANQDCADEILRQNHLAGNNFIVFIPGSNPDGKLKRWGASRYAALADKLYAKGIGPAVLVGGPDDQEECAQIVAQVKHSESVVNLCCKTQILDIVPLVEKAGFIVSSDTGPAHVASAASRPMLVICGPTDPKRVKPAGDHVATIQADIDCINCYKKECSHHSCMAAITEEMVLEKIKAGLGDFPGNEL